MLPKYFFYLAIVKAVIQRVSSASVNVDGSVVGSIEKGLLILLGVTHDDNQDDIDYLSSKISGLRVFNDAAGKMNLDLNQVEGEVLVISQFTLMASTAKGNRPSYLQAASPNEANRLYEIFKRELYNKVYAQRKMKPATLACGIFGADMKVSLVNDGPVTIIIDSKNRE